MTRKRYVGARPERPRRPSSPDSPWDACGRDRVWGRPHSRGRAPTSAPVDAAAADLRLAPTGDFPGDQASRKPRRGARARGAATRKAFAAPRLNSREFLRPRSTARRRIVRHWTTPGRLVSWGTGVKSRRRAASRYPQATPFPRGFTTARPAFADKRRAALVSLKGECQGRLPERRMGRAGCGDASALQSRPRGGKSRCESLARSR